MALLGRLAAESELVVDWHRRIFFPWIAGYLQRVALLSTGSVGEIVAVVGLLLLAGALARFGARAFGPAGLGLGVSVLLFYAFWGLAYHYPGLATRLSVAGREGRARGGVPELRSAVEGAARLLDRAARDLPADSRSEADRLVAINEALPRGFSRLPASLEASPVHGQVFSPAKASRVSFALSRLQLSGYFFPWTGEALINDQMPRSLWPRVVAHELAHQRGFARENEATVMGVLACLASDDPRVFYSGVLGLFAALDRDFAEVDQDARRLLWEGLPDRVRSDFRAETEFWASYKGPAGAVSERVNDAYLKAQGIESGVVSYSETVQLFLQTIGNPSLKLGSLLEAAGAGPLPSSRPSSPEG